MKKILISSFVLFFLATTLLPAQKYFTRSGTIDFYSDAPLEKIEAHNSKATCVLDARSGRMEFAVLIKAFHFEKALMQEHFNENYMESDKYPKAFFKGQILDLDQLSLTENGSYDVKVKGTLTIHGVSQEIETAGQLLVAGGDINAKASFDVAVADYKIEIPKLVRENIAKNVKIDIDVPLKPMKAKKQANN